MLDRFKIKNVKFALFPKSKIQGNEAGKSTKTSLSGLSQKLSSFFSSKISKINATTEEVVGIDISHEAIHVAQASKKTDEKWVLDKFSYRFLDQTKIKENLLESSDYLVSEITLALANANITTKNVAQKNYLLLKKYITSELMKCELGNSTAFEGIMSCSWDAGERTNNLVSRGGSSSNSFEALLNSKITNPYNESGSTKQVWNGSWNAVGVGRIGIAGDGKYFNLCFNDPAKPSNWCSFVQNIDNIPAK